MRIKAESKITAACWTVYGVNFMAASTWQKSMKEALPTNTQTTCERNTCIDTVQDCLYGTSIYTDAQKLARRLFEEVVTDVVLECEDCDDVSSIDDEGREEVKRRWVPFLEMLPEYKSICEDILAGNKDKYSE